MFTLQEQGHSSSPCYHTLFELVDYSKSVDVVKCFLCLLLFTMSMEYLLIKIEKRALGTVAYEVLQKLYKVA